MPVLANKLFFFFFLNTLFCTLLFHTKIFFEDYFIAAHEDSFILTIASYFNKQIFQSAQLWLYVGVHSQNHLWKF